MTPARFVSALVTTVVTGAATATLVARLDRERPPTATGIFGFRSASLAGEQELERRFLALPSADRAREYHRFLTNEPHVAGSDRNRALAEWVRDRWIDYGIDEVSIVEHEVLLPWPEDVSVEIAGRSWKATLYEDPIPGDPDTQKPVLHYHAYSTSRDFEAGVQIMVDAP